MKIIKKFIYSIISITSFALVSCSSDDGSGGSSVEESSDKVRLTVTVSNSYSTDNAHHISLGFGGFDADSKVISVTVNGELRTNQPVVSVNAAAFNTTKTYILESVGRFNSVSANVSGFNLSDIPFTVSYKIEKGSKVIVDQTKEITEDSGTLSEPFTVNFKD